LPILFPPLFSFNSGSMSRNREAASLVGGMNSLTATQQTETAATLTVTAYTVPGNSRTAPQPA